MEFKITISFSLPPERGDFDSETIKRNAEALIIMASKKLNEEDKLLDYSYESNWSPGITASEYDHMSEYEIAHCRPIPYCNPRFKLFFEKTFPSRLETLDWAHTIQKSILELWENKKEELKGDMPESYDIAIEEITGGNNK